MLSGKMQNYFTKSDFGKTVNVNEHHHTVPHLRGSLTVLFVLVSHLTCSLLALSRWNCIVTTHGPPPMAGHSASVIGNTMVVFGGSLGARQMYVRSYLTPDLETRHSY